MPDQIKERLNQVILMLVLIIAASVTERHFFDPRTDPFTGHQAALLEEKMKNHVSDQITKRVPPPEVSNELEHLNQEIVELKNIIKNLADQQYQLLSTIYRLEAELSK